MISLSMDQLDKAKQLSGHRLHLSKQLRNLQRAENPRVEVQVEYSGTKVDLVGRQGSDLATFLLPQLRTFLLNQIAELDRQLAELGIKIKPEDGDVRRIMPHPSAGFAS